MDSSSGEFAATMRTSAIPTDPALTKKAETILRFFGKGTLSNRSIALHHQQSTIVFLPMNRIYQGRVTKVEIKNPDKQAAKTQPWLLYHHDPKRAAELTKKIPELRKQVEPEAAERAKLSKEDRKKRAKSNELQEYERLRDEQLEEWQDTLWQHHQLFQDAVNYYLAAFAAMVPLESDQEVWTDLRDTIIRSWDIYTGRQGSWERPFASVCQAIRASEKTSFQDFRKKLILLSGSKATEEQRYLALREVFESAVEAARKMEKPDESLEESLKGKGKNLFNKLVVLCARKTGETSGETKGAQRNAAREATTKVHKGGRLTWDDVFLFKTAPGGEPLSRKEASDDLLQFFDDIVECVTDTAKSLESKARTVTKAEQLAKIQQRYQELSSLANKIQKRRKEFETWIRNPKTELPDKKPSRKGSGGYDLKSAVLLALRSGWSEFRESFLLLNGGRLNEQAPAPRKDACYAARFAGRIECRVFPFFLDVWSRRLGDDSVRQGVCPDFEKQAFIEVFNKIGQFILRERKFELRLKEANQIIKTIDERLKKDTRLQSIRDIAGDLAAKSEIVSEDGTPSLYSIRERTLKAWSRVRRAWKAQVAADVNVTTEQLVEEKICCRKSFARSLAARLCSTCWQHIVTSGSTTMKIRCRSGPNTSKPKKKKSISKQSGCSLRRIQLSRRVTSVGRRQTTKPTSLFQKTAP